MTAVFIIKKNESESRQKSRLLYLFPIPNYKLATHRFEPLFNSL